MLTAILVTSGLLYVFVKVAGEVREGETSAFDDAILNLFRSPSGELVGPGWLPEAVRDITALGSYMVLAFFVIILVIYFLAVRRRIEAGFLEGSVIGGTILSNILKVGFNRPRPELDNTPEVFSASFRAVMQRWQPWYSSQSARSSRGLNLVVDSTTSSCRWLFS